ncbi:MAG TPA: phosphoribosylanthranilate isomerase [Thermoanaerobaculia bacterium]|nr:phosphoribosylanthranilate isomerase [Thermoanaerobaculia bacterium]
MAGTRVKICGLTRPRDVELACELGAAWLGFNFAAVSPRRVTVEAARELASLARPGTVRVGVFVEESRDRILEAIEGARLDAVQIHRPLRESDLDLPRPVLAVARMRNGSPALPPADLLCRCRLVLLDAEAPGQPGGTGRTLDWEDLSGRSWPIPLMLAGGLTPENVEAAIGRARPAAVDVASGVESSPGVKDEDRMRRFFEAVRRADSRA